MQASSLTRRRWGERLAFRAAVLLGCLIVNLCLLVLVKRHFNAVFATNDDYRMRLIVSGAYTGAPSGQAVYLNILLGRALAGLYRAWPGVEWYGLFYYGTIYVFACVTDALLLCRARKATDFFFRLGCVALLSVVTLFNHLLMPQFTAVAAFWTALSVTACLAFFDAGSRAGKLFWAALYVVSVFMAMLVRRMLFLMFLPMEVIFFLSHVLEEGIGRKARWRRAVLCLAVFGAACAAIVDCTAADYSANQSREYRDFLAFRDARGHLYDYSDWPDYEEDEAFYASIGVTQSAWDCLNARTFDINPDVNSETLEAVYDYARARDDASLAQRLAQALAGGLDGLSIEQCVREVEVLALLLLLAFVVLRQAGATPRTACILWGSFLYCAAALAGLLLMGRIMARIVQSIAIVLIAVLFYLLGGMRLAPLDADRSPWTRLATLFKGCVAVLAALAVASSSVLWLTGEDEYRVGTLQRRTDELLAMEAYMADRPNEFLFYNALDFIGGSDYVFSEPREGTLNMDSLGNWNVFSPDYYARNAQFGFTSALDGLLNGRALYARLHKLTPAPIEATLNEYGKTLVKIDELEAAGDTIVIYRAVSLQ